MQIFNGPNALESIVAYAGTDWHLFVFDGAEPASIAAAPFDVYNEQLLFQNSIGCIRTLSAIMATPYYGLEFSAVQALTGYYSAPGFDQSEPKQNGNNLYRLGFKQALTDIPNVSFAQRLDMIGGRQVALTTNSTNKTLSFDLYASSRVNALSINVAAGVQYVVYGYNGTPQEVLFSATGPVSLQQVNFANCTQILIAFQTIGAVNFTQVTAYTTEVPAAVPAKTPTWGILRPIAPTTTYIPAGSTYPLFLVSVSGPAGSGAARLNKATIPAAGIASLMYLRLRPSVMEV